MVVDGFAEHRPIARHRFFGVQADVVVPFVERTQTEVLLDGGKQRISFEPGALRAAEGGYGLGIACATAQKGLVQHVTPVLEDTAIVHARRICAPVHALQLLRQQQPVLDQQVQVDQIRVAREGGRALIRRVAKAGGAEREHLPVGLACFGEKIGEGVSIPAQRPDTIGRGQGGDVHQNAAAAFHKNAVLLFSFVLIIHHCAII